MTKPKILVLGASGSVAKATFGSLVSRHGSEVEIFAGSRDPSKFSPIDGVEAIQADMGDTTEGLVTTLSGFDRVYIVTPSNENRTELVLNGLKAAKEAGVKFVLVVSVLNAELTDTVFGKQFAPIEEATKAAGFEGYTILRLPIFLDNIYGSAGTIKESSVFYDPRGPDKLHTPVAMVDIGKASADILADPEKHYNKTYKIVMPSFSLNQLAAAFTETLGKEVKVVTVPYPAFKDTMLGYGLPEWQVDGISDLYHLIDAESPVLNETESTDDFENITGEKASTVEEWVKANKAGFE